MESTLALKSKRKTIEEPMEKQEIWAFTDTKCQVNKKIALKWNTVFQEFHTKQFQFLLKDDMSMKLSKGIYNNITTFGLHRAVAKTIVLPCPNVIEWMTQRIDFDDKHVASYQSPVLNQLYHFKEAWVKVTQEWLKNKTKSVNFLSIMKGWWSKGKFRAKTSPIEWRTSKFRKRIQIIVIMLARVFRRKDASSFPEKWIPIIHQVITHGSTLNWGDIISSNLDIQLKKTHKEHKFYMSSYLLDVMCASR